MVIIKLQFNSNESGDVKKQTQKETNNNNNQKKKQQQKTDNAVPGITENTLFLEDISLARELSRHF